ncbi:MAG: phosphate regulon sensor protein PhoR, partial [Lysobacterales bacterium]
MGLLSHNAWQVSIGRFVLLVAVALLVGLALGRVQLALLVALAGYVAMSLRSLYRIQRWLRSRLRVPPPEDWGVWSDVAHTVYRRLEQERSRKRRLVRLLRAFREAAAVLPDGVVITTLGREVVWFNEAAERLLGLHPRRDRGARLDRSLVHPRVQRWLSEPGFPEPLIDVPAPHDSAMRLSMRMIPYTRQQQLLVTRDITNLMRLEQMRRDFVANVSHELRTPLTVLHGYLDMIDPEESPEWAPMLDEMRRQSTRMAEIVEDLLTLSRLEAQLEVLPERVVMSSMLTTLQREAEALSLGRHRIIVHARTASDLSGSTKDLHSAFSNLVSNAVRYTPAGGQV